MICNKRRKWSHSSCVKLLLVNTSASCLLVSTYLIWILVKLILSNNQSSATLLVLETCLIVGLLPFMIILITASLSSKCTTETQHDKNLRVWWRSPHATIAQHLRFPFQVWISFFANSFLLRVIVGVLLLFDERNISITTSHKSRAGNDSIRSPASNEMISDSLELFDTDVCFLHIQLMWQMSDFQKHMKSRRSWFWILKVASKIWVLEWTQSTMLSRATHITILSVATCVMNVRNQSCWTSVTRSCPFGDWSSKFVYGPKKVRSTNSCKVQAFQDHVRAYLWQFSDWFKFFLFEVMGCTE